MRCPICERDFQPDQSPARPFCSERCRTIDLGRWLGESYAVPSDIEADDGEEELPEPPGRSTPADDDGE